MARRGPGQRCRTCGGDPVIFVTVGTQLPFPRLIDAMNDLAPSLDDPVVAQTCADGASRWSALDVRSHVAPEAFEALFTQARLVVAHAGMGSILSAQRWRKPLIIMPRRHDLNEHRNDHQMATARHFDDRPGIQVAWTVEDLEPLVRQPDPVAATQAPSPDRDALVARLRDFIAS